MYSLCCLTLLYYRKKMFFGGRTLVNVDDWRQSVRGLQKSRRLGDGSKRKQAVYKRYRTHSPCFLMKTRLRRPHLPSGRRQMPFYTQPVFTKNQSARALGILQPPDTLLPVTHVYSLIMRMAGWKLGGEHGCFAACGRFFGRRGCWTGGFTSLISVIFYDL